MTDVERLLAGRKFIDDYRAVHSSTGEHETDKLISGLKELGFNSIEEFFQFNAEMNLAEAKLCIAYEGKCNKCEGKPKACVLACYEKKTDGDKKELTADISEALNHRHYWKDYYQSLPLPKLGMVYPILPGCSIMNKVIVEPHFNIRWE